MKNLPPELVPQPVDTSRESTLRDCAALLVKLAAPGNTHDFALLVLEGEGRVTGEGYVTMESQRLIAFSSCHSLLELAEREGDGLLAQQARAALRVLGSRLLSQEGGMFLDKPR